MSEENNEKVVALNDLKNVTDDIYAELGKKATAEHLRDAIRVLTPEYATDTEVEEMLIPKADKNMITPTENQWNAAQYAKMSWQEYTEYINKNGRMPWDIINCEYLTNLEHRFYQLAAVPEFINYDMINSLAYAFESCQFETAPEIKIEGSDPIDMTYTFYQCQNLKDLSPLKVETITGEYAFANTSIEKGPDVKKICGNCWNMFYGCHKLKELPEYDLSECTNMCGMFSSTGLPEEFPWVIDLSNIRTTSGIASMFSDTKVKKLKVKNVHPELNPDSPKSVLGTMSLGGWMGSFDLEVEVENYLSY